jgi:hypothetical protein
MFKKNKSEENNNYPINTFKIISRLFIFLSIVFILWIIIVASGIIINDMEPNWAYLTLENWVLLSIVIIIFFALIEIIFYLYATYYSDKIIEFEEIEPETIHGKKVYIYTNPINAKGGVFSKTYIQINDESVLKFRNQIIPPTEL